MNPPLADLKDFLLEAHRNTYANATARKVASLRPLSKDYHFEHSDFAYHDTYFGGRRFAGEEIVYFQNKPIWGMNYYGSPVSAEISEDDIDAILRPALMQAPWEDLPVRGPKHFVDGPHEYFMQIREGALERFSAEERILLNGRIIYQCFLQGGLIV